jgi:hypothetical protein
MIIQYQILWSLRITHSYYGGTCPDFEFIVPAEAANTARGGRLLFKVLDGVLHLLFEADDGGAPRVSIAGARLRVGLRLINPAFSNFTEFSSLGTGTPAYRNGAAPTALDAPESRTLVAAVFSHALSQTGRPVTVTLKDASGLPLSLQTVTAENDRPSVSFDLSGVEPGALSIDEDYGGGNVRSTLYYLHPELQAAGVFGIVDIDIASAFYSSAPAFAIGFNARQQTLKYYFVVNNHTDAEFNSLGVADSGFTEEARPEIAFTRVLAAAFTSDELSPSLLASGDARLVLFKSNAAVARQQPAPRKIQLRRSSDVLIEHLPQPSADRPDANLIIHISK